MKGTITDVNIGPLVIEGVLGEDGNLYVQVREVASLFQLRQDNAARDLKVILGEASSCVKISIQGDGANKSQNTCIALSDFALLRQEGLKSPPISSLIVQPPNSPTNPPPLGEASSGEGPNKSRQI
jgi:hypothetical protein